MIWKGAKYCFTRVVSKLASEELHGLIKANQPLQVKNRENICLPFSTMGPVRINSTAASLLVFSPIKTRIVTVAGY